MAPVAFWSQFVLLALNHISSAAASPIDSSAQHNLKSSDLVVVPTKGSHSRKLNGKFLHITDFHPDPFYQVHSSTAEGVACHRKKGVAGTYGAETSDCDSPFSLVNATFDWISENIKDDVDFVVWTGDSARHDSDEKHPRHADEVLNTNQMMVDKFLDTFSSKNGALDIPIVPTWGNNDFLPHNIFYPGPNKWLRKYSDMWQRFIPETQRHSFEFGGWFWTEVIPNQLAVFSLNTMYFFDRNAGVDGCANPSEPGFQHLDWLDIQLQSLRRRGMKAILTGHVPPARTSSKQNWDETCWQKYTLWLKQYRDVVVGSLYGHMNIDHFLLQDTKQIDINAVAAASLDARESIDEGFGISSKEDYLQDLRKDWGNLPGSIFKPLLEEDMEDSKVDASKKKKKHKKKKNKYKKIGGKYAERYILSLVSPSIVPNYFPTLRIIEYNISGIEDAPVWTDTFYKAGSPTAIEIDSEMTENDSVDPDGSSQELKRDLEAEGKKKKKKKGKKGKKGKKPKDPHLEVPEGPPKGSTPGPAYFPQTLTFTGYTQYFANLTHINNDLTKGFDDAKWRDGDYIDEQPKDKVPKPKPFKYEVEYSTFDDKIYRLKDMTVLSYLKLAYKIGLKKKVKGLDLNLWEDDKETSPGVIEDDDTDEDILDRDSDDDSDDTVDSEGKGKKKHKKKRAKNKTWLHFLDHAFVRTVSDKDLDKMR